METEPERAAEIGTAIRRVVAHETIQAWMWDIWSRASASGWRPTSPGRTAGWWLTSRAPWQSGRHPGSRSGARARLQTAAEGVIRSLLPSAQLRIAEFIAQVVANWDTETIVDRLELRIGRDLQYIRMNGTIVGFLIGGLLYAMLDTMLLHTTF